MKRTCIKCGESKPIDSFSPRENNARRNDCRSCEAAAKRIRRERCYVPHEPPAPDRPGEQWLPVVGYEGWYEVSDLGRVRNVRRRNRTWMHRLLTLHMGRAGYYRVMLTKTGHAKTFSVHRLVATAYIRPPNEDEIANHINGLKTDNRAVNLEWETQSGNVRHSLRLGLRPNQERGSRHHMAKLTEDDVRQIRALRGIETGRAIADRFGVGEATVSMIQTGKIWTHVS